MTSRLERLLVQKEPLEPHEISDLEEWLDVLRTDTETYGCTAEDRSRISAIRIRIKIEQSN